MEVGRCSHWLRPHQTRWTADGGFAWPAGYGSGQGGHSIIALPQFDWSVMMRWDDGSWSRASDKSARPALRVTLPARTTRHEQAVVHAVWTGREKERRFYGFRRKAGVGTCTVESRWEEDRLRQRQRC